jgi:hypothetical protein
MKSIFRIILIAGMFVISKTAFAQEPLNFSKVNERTYDFYLKRDWKSLIKLGKESRKADIDFYYLKVRMGVAFYNLKKYRQAIPYFENALIDSPGDEFVLEHLYFAYVLSGRKTDSRKLLPLMSPVLKESLGIKDKTGLSAIGFELKYDSWADYKITGQTIDTVQQSVQDGYNYFGLNAAFEGKKGTKVNIGFSRVGITEDGIWLGSDNVLTGIDREIGQNQLYIRLLTTPQRSWDFVVAANLLFLSLTDKYTVIKPISNLKAGFGPGSGGGIGGGRTGFSILSTYNSANGNNFDIVSHIGLFKNFSFFRAGVSASFAGLGNNLQIQPGLSLSAYPLGNTNFYTLSSVQFLWEKYDTYNESRMVFKQAAGVNIAGLYIEPSATIGEFYNLIEGEGNIINNTNDILASRFELLTYTFLFKGKLSLFLKYQKYQRINYYIINGNIKSINYPYQSLIGGITWNIF